MMSPHIAIYRAQRPSYRTGAGVDTDIPTALEGYFITSTATCYLDHTLRKALFMACQIFAYAFRPMLVKPSVVPRDGWIVLNWVIQASIYVIVAVRLVLYHCDREHDISTFIAIVPNRLFGPERAASSYRYRSLDTRAQAPQNRDGPKRPSQPSSSAAHPSRVHRARKPTASPRRSPRRPSPTPPPHRRPRLPRPALRVADTAAAGGAAGRSSGSTGSSFTSSAGGPCSTSSSPPSSRGAYTPPPATSSPSTTSWREGAPPPAHPGFAPVDVGMRGPAEPCF